MSKRYPINFKHLTASIIAASSVVTTWATPTQASEVYTVEATKGYMDCVVEDIIKNDAATAWAMEKCWPRYKEHALEITHGFADQCGEMDYQLAVDLANKYGRSKKTFDMYDELNKTFDKKECADAGKPYTEIEEDVGPQDEQEVSYRRLVPNLGANDFTNNASFNQETSEMYTTNYHIPANNWPVVGGDAIDRTVFLANAFNRNNKEGCKVRVEASCGGLNIPVNIYFDGTVPGHAKCTKVGQVQSFNFVLDI